jgi:phospho-N-acetylmuramoyl-pentapeptide-transferase
MLYYLFQYFQDLDLPGAGVFQFISFRVAMALIFSLLISLIYGKRIIRLLQRKQMGEQIRDLGLHGLVRSNWFFR